MMNTIEKHTEALKHTEAGKFEETRYEKIHNAIFDNSDMASVAVAQYAFKPPVTFSNAAIPASPGQTGGSVSEPGTWGVHTR